VGGHGGYSQLVVVCDGKEVKYGEKVVGCGGKGEEYGGKREDFGGIEMW